MKKYKKLSEKKLTIKDQLSGYDKEIISKTYKLPNGIIENFFVDNDKDSVQILPITEDGMVLCVKQFRPGLEKESTELPGGGLERDEDPAEAAKRELLEETGYEGNIFYLGKMNYSPYSTGIRYMFVANKCKKIDRLDLDENEFIQVLKWPMNHFKTAIGKGEIRGTDCAYMGLQHLDLLK